MSLCITIRIDFSMCPCQGPRGPTAIQERMDSAVVEKRDDGQNSGGQVGVQGHGMTGRSGDGANKAGKGATMTVLGAGDRGAVTAWLTWVRWTAQNYLACCKFTGRAA